MAATTNRFGAAAALRTGPKPPPGSDGEELRKYTVKLTTTLANQFDEDLLAIRRSTGKKVDKSEIVRILVTLLHDDPTLMAAVVHQLVH